MFNFFERLIEPFPEYSNLQPPKGLWAFCRFYSKGTGKYLLLMALFAAAIAVIEASLFSCVGKLVDWLGTANRGGFFAENSGFLISGALLMALGVPLVEGLRSVITHQTLIGNFPMRIRWLAHKYLLGQSLSFYQNDLSGRVATKVMQTALAVRETVMRLLDILLYIVIYFVSVVAVLSIADWRLALPLLVWFCLYSFVLYYFLPRLKRVAQTQADARSTMTGILVDSYTNITTLKLFSRAQRESDYAKDGMKHFLKTVHPQMRLVTLLTFSVSLCNYFLLAAVVLAAIYLWSISAISVGEIAVALGMCLRVNGMSVWIMWEIGALFENIGTVQDGVDTLSMPQQITDQNNAAEIKVSNGKIQFKDLNFQHGKKQIFESLNLTIQAGEKIGLVGRSGAGKSTLVNLLLRFYDPNAGAILVDDQNIAEITQDSLRSQIGMVTQDTSLLHRSVRDNILFGKPNASDHELFAATKDAEAHDFILQLDDGNGGFGYNSMVGERGVKLSGGQRQRIAIARVLLKNAPILVLDEATSALDSEAEIAIQHSLNELMEGKTVIAIAHRLSTIAALDRLIVMDEGKIIEQGSHQELLAKGGVYAHLWQHQSGGFLGCD